MPLVAYKELPTFQRLKSEGRTVIPAQRALEQDIREMHIGLLNMMPDAALEATERQFFRLIGESNQIAQLYVHPFTLPEIPRSDETKTYINTYYEPFEKIQEQGLDGLIITGANVENPDLSLEPFWEPLQKVFDWSWNNVCSTMCSCLSTHAMMQFRYNQNRQPLPDGEKLWGIYKHKVIDRTHPLVRNMNTVFDVPHSRYNQITEDQFKSVNMKVLIASEEAGIHMAVSPDGFRLVCMQGHPEYDAVSLLKEYQRDSLLFAKGERKSPPPLPHNYFSHDALNLLKSYDPYNEAPHKIKKFNAEICNLLENTWTDSARSILASWIGLIYQTTNINRQKQFMENIDPSDPLKGL